MNKRIDKLLSRIVIGWVVVVVVSSCSVEKNRQSLPSPEYASPSAGISSTQASQIIPLAISSLSVKTTGEGIELTWMGTGEDAIQYEIYRGAFGVEKKIATMNSMGNNQGIYTYRDTTAQRGVKYIYGIRTRSSYGKESALVQSAEISRSLQR